jgi:hypothetical protein
VPDAKRAEFSEGSEGMEGVWHAVEWLVVNPSAFVDGVLGGLAAELLRVYRVENLIQRPVGQRWLAILISLAMIVLGGLYASRIIAADTHYVGFVAGLTLPPTLSTLLGTRPPGPRRPRRKKS